MLTPGANLSAQERALLRSWRGLDEQGRKSLLDFAEFLQSRQPETVAVPQEPLDIPRPDSESVVKAIKRLTKTYPMIDKGQLFNETSLLMSQHIMQGREAVEVIDELESMFRERYEKREESGK